MKYFLSYDAHQKVSSVLTPMKARRSSIQPVKARLYDCLANEDKTKQCPANEDEVLPKH